MREPGGARPAIVTAAFPFVPAVLSTAHAASTYVPADVTVRLLRMLGRPAVLASGMDVHSVQVSRDGMSRTGVEEMCDAAEAKYRAFLASWDIEPDLWFRTDEHDHIERTRGAFERLRARGALAEIERAVDICNGCGAAVPPRLATSGACPWCGGPPASTPRLHFHLPLERWRDPIAADAPRFPPAARGWLAGLLGAPLEPWCLTRDNRVGITFDEGPTSLYLWFDSLIGYLTIRDRIAARDPTFADAEMLQFFGKNIIYHHGAVQPALLAALGDTLDFRASVRGFLAEPLALEASSAGTRDARRLYLVFKTFDAPRDFTLSESEYAAFVRERVIGRLGNLLRRCALQAQRGACDAAAGRALVAERSAALRPLLDLHAGCGEPRLALLAILDEAKRLTAAGQGERWLIDDDEAARGKAAGALSLLLTLLAPYAPDAVMAFAIFDGWAPGTLGEAGAAIGRPLTPRPLRWPD
jgi:methionyl-tRNA synthetase